MSPDTKNIPVVGFDPSFKSWGYTYGWINIDTDEFTPGEIGIIETQKSKLKTVRVSSDRLKRGQTLVSGIKSIMDEIHPKIIFSEIPQGSQSAVAAMALGVTIGIIASISIPVIQVQPSDVKIAATGSKTASKQQMIDWAIKNNPSLNWFKRAGILTKKNEHPADAIAAVIAGLKTDQYKQLKAILL